jgi:ABC-type transport system involved in multi-copper enzyme maturation permease subunit
MLSHIIRKELLDQLLSLRFAIACVVCLVVLLLSSIVLTRDYREAMSTYNMNKVMHRNDVTQRTGVQDLWQGVTVDRPLNVMNVLVRGISAELTESVRVQNGNRMDFLEVYEQNPVVPLFPEVDFVFISGIIMSLLALAFSYDAISGERESGVLKVVMSYSVPRDTLLLGKWIGGYLALIAPFVMSFIAGLVVMALFPEVEIGTDNFLSIFALLLLALLYLAAIYSLGVFVSCRTEIASTSITVLLLVWVVFILAIPNMAPYFTGQLIPAPSRTSIDRGKLEVQQETMRLRQKMMRDEQERSGKEDVWNDEDFQEKLRIFHEEREAEAQKIEDSFMAKIRAQTRWSTYIARISPLTSFNLAALDLAAAGINQEVHFVDALKEYSSTWGSYSDEKSKAWQDFMKERRSSGSRMMFTSADMEQFNNMDYSDYPRFTFTYMPFKDRLQSVYKDVLLLGVWNVLFFMLAYLSFLRYDVR